METYNNRPNFSIVTSKCNANCSFCYNDNQKIECDNYIKNLSKVISLLPSDKFKQCSITGGEPTMSKYFVDILSLVKPFFDKVVLTTNGYKLLENIPYMDGVVNYINISRHSICDAENSSIFKSNSIPSSIEIKKAIIELNKIGIPANINVVVDDNKDKSFVSNFIEYCKFIGANSITFRKVSSGDLSFKLLDSFSEYKTIDSDSCPVCTYSCKLINGLYVGFKTSMDEPSDVLTNERIYELIYKPNGVLYSDWNDKNEVKLS